MCVTKRGLNLKHACLRFVLAIISILYTIFNIEFDFILELREINVDLLTIQLISRYYFFESC